MPGADRNIVEDAESRRRPELGMVPRRPHQGEGIVRLPKNHAVDGVHDAARREPRHVVRLGGGHRIGIEHEDRFPGRGGDGIDVRRQVDPLELFALGNSSVNPGEFPHHVGIVEHFVDRSQSLRRLGWENSVPCRTYRQSFTIPVFFDIRLPFLG